MAQTFKKQLISLAWKHISTDDVSHDFYHAMRVLENAETIAEEEKGDLQILIPAALFHDLIVYPKNHPDTAKSQQESAEMTEALLKENTQFPENKIESVKTCILECSFTQATKPTSLESQILQDADGLESTGAISIMRTFASTGQMKRPFYHVLDPFCENRKPTSCQFAIDLFYNRLLLVEERMHTKTAKKIAMQRTAFLRIFLQQLEREIGENE